MAQSGWVPGNLLAKKELLASSCLRRERQERSLAQAFFGLFLGGGGTSSDVGVRSRGTAHLSKGCVDTAENPGEALEKGQEKQGMKRE